MGKPAAQPTRSAAAAIAATHRVGPPGSIASTALNDPIFVSFGDDHLIPGKAGLAWHTPTLHSVA
ncbi:MAG: hypothetical protein KDF63_02850 [Rhodoferax sp.]|jgi:hypothetical protein|nr:hypothetical protein [Rhodoferax sp.]MCL4737460.1 hypothetical protein [Burkholderiaceae bacterium]MCP5288169.1 hypothetical protein [Burkholderiaceae bacterium]HMQ74272.1 hypothetical protein [Rubrivivax sp.]